MYGSFVPIFSVKELKSFCIVLVTSTPGLIREVYTDIKNIESGEMRSLYRNRKYPSNPDEVSLVQNFDAPQNIGDNYGQRIRGYFLAPDDGEYKFFSSCDQMCELYLSMDDQPEHVGKIINQLQPSKHNEFDK